MQKMIFHEKENRGVISFSLFMIFVFLAFAVKLPADWLLSLDTLIQKFTTIPADSGLAKIFETVAFFGNPAAALIISAGLVIYFIIKKERVTALWIAFTILGGDAIAFFVKEFIQRPRPSDIIGGDSGYSFPSGHVFGTTLLVLFLIYIVTPRIKNYQNRFIVNCLLWIWLFIIATSRIYLRAHYPSDIVGSLLLASSWWGFAQILYLKFYDQAYRVLYRMKLNKDSE